MAAVVAGAEAGAVRHRNIGDLGFRHEEAEAGDASIEASEAKKTKRTYGRVPNGAVFIVPQTHDMVSQLLDPRQPRNFSDFLVLFTIVLQMITLYALPTSFKKPVFACIFLLWRGMYNGGIGYLLRMQSNHGRLVAWAKHYHLFAEPLDNPRPWLYRILKRELETKIPKDYKFEDAPIEYNTWLVFRRLIDIILMNDFTSFSLFAIACANCPAEEGLFMTIARWTAGLLLVSFNAWVKVAAHKVIGEYAWYWGDFFFLIDAELTFDSVFLMAPHPMYSIGYAGFYGVAMLSASYSVLLISVIAHASQFAFLIYIENPHIERVYGASKKRHGLAGSDTQSKGSDTESHEKPASKQPLNVHNLLGLHNLDLLRVTDVSVIILLAQVGCLAAWTPSTPRSQAAFIFNAVIWRLIFSVGLGFVLEAQSTRKMWTAHYLKYGQTVEEAWLQWKGIYHILMTMCYASFITAAWKMYSLPTDWSSGFVLLRHIIGASLIALQVWTAVNVYASLGEFNWYFGDFFFDPPKLAYSGIYRFLNNPGRLLGLAGLWAAPVITGSKAIFFLALLSHVASLCFIQWVEQPHMKRVYGDSVRKEAGITKGLKTAVPSQIHESVEKVIQETSHAIEEFLETARPKLTAGVTTVVGDLFKTSKTDVSVHSSQYPARVTITRVAPELAGFNPKDYSIRIAEPNSSSAHVRPTDISRRSPNNASAKQYPGNFRPLVFDYGAPIKITWTAPSNHSGKDWVGLYMVADNNSRDVTRVSSAGRWVSTVGDKYEADEGILSSNMPIESVDGKLELVSGEIVFAGDRLFWASGVYECRYHHDGRHNVMAISLPFEIRIGRCESEDLAEIERVLIPLVRNCFDRDAEIAPKTATQHFGPLASYDPKYAKRVTYAVHQLFGIEFAPEVFLADGNIRNLAFRVANAKQALAPFNMSRHIGNTTST